MKKILLYCFASFFISVQAQDTLYARQVIKKLTSKEMFGRGYLNNGLDIAAKYIVDQMEQMKAQPLFSTGYYQWFDQNVNTFPGKVTVKINGKLLKPGYDYIFAPESGSIKGKYNLVKKDSVTYIAEGSPIPLIVSLKKKLTFSVADKAADYAVVEILQQDPSSGEPKKIQEFKNIEVNIESKVLTKYICKNVCGFIPGKEKNDTCIVFTAHYDHLGGMGKQIYFPGANDNASGVSMLLNIMRYYYKNPPKYKTVFIFFAGEEAGLLGSKHFVDESKFDLKSIKFLLNLDLLGTGDDGIMVVNATEFKAQFEKLKSVNDQRHLVKEIRQRGKASISDHYWFSEKGVPCFFIYTLGGIKAYHDVQDIEKTLPLTDYTDVMKLLIEYVKLL
jgi:aminopeptidase YwaD